MSIPWLARIEPYPKQQAAIFDPPRDAIIIASPKAGKTVAALQWLIEQTDKNGGPGRYFLWVSPTFRTSEIAFTRAYTEILNLEHIDVHKTKHTITLPNGSIIFFGSADKPDNIYGEDYWAVCCDEVTRMSLEAWIAITSTTQHTNAPFRLIGNNVRKNNWAKKLAKRAQQGLLPDMEYHRLRKEDAIEAGVIVEEADSRTRLYIPEDEYAILYEGDDADGLGIGIDTFRLKVAPVPDVTIKARAWDFAASEDGDYTVGARIEASSEGFWITDIARAQLPAEEVLDFIAEVAALDGLDVDQVAEEEKGASGSLFVESLRRELDMIPSAGPVYAAPVEQNKKVRAWPFATAVRRNRVFLSPDLEIGAWLEELDEWPDGRHDDVIDSLGHCFNHLAPMVQGMIGTGWTPSEALV